MMAKSNPIEDLRELMDRLQFSNATGSETLNLSHRAIEEILGILHQVSSADLPFEFLKEIEGYVKEIRSQLSDLLKTKNIPSAAAKGLIGAQEFLGKALRNITTAVKEDRFKQLSIRVQDIDEFRINLERTLKVWPDESFFDKNQFGDKEQEKERQQQKANPQPESNRVQPKVNEPAQEEDKPQQPPDVKNTKSQNESMAMQSAVPAKVDDTKSLESRLAQARAIDDQIERVDALIKLLPLVPETVKQKITDEIFKDAKDIPNQLLQVDAMTKLLPYMTDDERRELAFGLLETARKISDPALQTNAIIKLLPYMPGTAQRELAFGLLETARKISDPVLQTNAIIKLLPYIPGTEQRQVASRLLETARQISDPVLQINAIIELLPYMLQNAQK